MIAKNRTRPNANNLIALPGGLAGDSTGGVVWWELTGNIDHPQLVKAWEEQGLDPTLLPELPSAKVALTRAVDDLIKESGARKKHRVADAHWLIYDVRTREDGTTEFVEVCDAMLNKDKTAAVLKMRLDTPTTLSRQIHDRFAVHQSRLEAQDIGTWLSTKLIGHVKAVSLRNRGGIYFVMRDQLETFQKMRTALRAVSSHLVFEMQALKSDEAVAAILHAITSEAKTRADDIEKVLDEGKVGAGAYKTQRDHAETMIKKVEAYEKLLDKNLDDIRERLADLSASSMEAAMAADAARQAARNVEKTK